jgi:hypothetical protein
VTRLALFYFPTFWHPLTGMGYQLWSGIMGATAIFSGILLFWHKHNCHEHHCLRLGWHPDPEGHLVCKVHHGDHPSRGWFRTDRSHPRHATNRTKEDTA